MSATIRLPTDDNKILSSMTINEYVDIKIIDKILYSNVLKTLNWKSEEVEKMTASLNILKKQVVKKTGYNALKFESRPVGRVYTKNNKISLGTLYRRVRHTLSKDYYVDVDIINCQPTILYGVLSNNNIESKYLDYYINNRDQIFHNIMINYSCKKDTAKEVIIALINGGSKKSWIETNNLKNKNLKIDNYLDNLSNELIKARNIIIKNNIDIIEKIKDYKMKNNKEYKGDYTFMSYFLGEYEKRIIEAVIHYLKEEKGRIDKNNVFVYCQDGIMILKDAYHEEDFKVIEKELLEKLGINIKFKVKEMDEAFTEEELGKESSDDETLFLQYKEEFEKEFFKLKNPICYVKELSNGRLQFFKESDFKLYLKDTAYIFNDKKKTFYDLWTSCVNKRVYDELVFDPCKLNDDINYNLFRGFPYDDNSVDDLNENESKVLQLINHLCFKDSNYFLDWISRMIQDPSKKTEWAIVLYSKVGGVGKNCMTDCLVKLIGEYSGFVSNIEDITKKFNAELCNKIFIYGDEINASAKKVADELKKVITGKEKNMERKGFDAIKIKDHSNYLFTTNNEHCFKIDEEDRRYLMIRCTNERKSDEFYKEFYQELDNEYKMKQLFKYFKNRIINYTLNKAPMTEYKQELITEQKPAYIQMLYKKPSLFSSTKISSTKLFEMSQEYAKKNYLTCNYTTTRFGLDIKQVIGKYKTVSNSVYFTFPSKKELQKHLYDHDQSYYRYMQGFNEEDIVDFDKDDENNNDENTQYLQGY